MIEIIIFIIIALCVIGWLRSQNDDNSSEIKDNKGDTNPRPQIGNNDENLLQHTNRVTHLHQHNYLDHRVVNNNLYVNASRTDDTKNNTAIIRKPRTTKYVMYDTERLRCFVSRKDTLLKKAEEIDTATKCDIYLEIRYEEKPYTYTSKTLKNYSLKQEDMDVTPSDESRRLIGKRRIESDDDSDTESNELSPPKIPKTVKETKNGGLQDKKENEMETEADKYFCDICGFYEDDNDDNKGPWVNCAYQYEDLSCCMYTAHVNCLDLHEYPQNFLCSEHNE
ncbi:uncharacterized protein LOC127734016 isoform X2 [Mytilus californianus]|uniref:uncharacterized protein LOC127734016 isoform X2 n=1 Tax=Mytilus californianus TaxID=6549 RepID=UPI002247A47A|nr:uncharacterized protein LOC127734016 isoform X2 [Mytilus californianus]